MRILVAPDKFKGTLSADSVCEALAAGVEDAEGEADRCPIADGGEGTAAVLVAARGGEWREASASDPLGRSVGCRFALIDEGDVAVVEVAEASGLWRLSESERDALRASSRGTGELIGAAIAAGARRVLVACGGSATTDGGGGALAAFDPGAAELVCLCDTDVAWDSAARVYGPQKGAGAAGVVELEGRLAEIAAGLPRDPSRVPLGGAAGGLAGGLWAHGAHLLPGARFVLEAIGFDRRLAAADLTITGEGRLDSTSLRGKAVGEVALRSSRAGVGCHAVVGGCDLDADTTVRAGLASVTVAGTAGALRAAASGLVGRG